MQTGSFDYIVIGAGSAGCVLANRLTASGRHNVLLLEAGPRDTDPWIHVPLGYAKLFTKKSVNWSYESEPEPGLGGRSIFTPRGKVLGGSSSINGLVYIRGQREDFDGWGVPGWGFDDLLPCFIKSEDQSRGASAWHGVGGPIAVSDLPDRHELCDAFIASAQALGIPRNDDFNGATQEGTGYYQATARNGRRCSAATGYLRPVVNRSNLRIEINALATRIVFEGLRATSVEFRQNGKTHSAGAREIILSGGTFNSPQLLQLSGVGPSPHLESLGIPVVLDAAGVGEALQDHLYVRTFWRCTKPVTLNDDMASRWRQLGIGLRYVLQRRGPLTVSAGYAAAFVRTRPELTRPDAQFYFINFSASKRGGFLHPFSGFTCSVSQLQAESRGWVRIRSADPEAPPSIQYNYLAAESDRRMMVDGLKLLRRLVNTRPFSDYVAEEKYPGPRVQSDEDWLGFCREAGETVFHPTSTCRMGIDAASVVDERLRVRGLAGLRVADASVMPSVPSGNINAAVIAVAEKGAELILEDSAVT
ncbi:MAG: GMC family oxidoreductase N-terminal domain-containing protein [Betaproteobacteria bacterium]|nr:GMC family oxidoreductase N-terminal domain-containing protein [Betaproteobacteria bacterium]